MIFVYVIGWIFITITVIAIAFGLFCWFSKRFFFHNKLEDIKINKPNLWIGILLILSILIIFFAFLAPVLFTNSSSYGDFNTSTGAVGDTIGGIMNPFIALAAVIVTGLAFYMQYQANKQVQDQFKLQQFESQFYEMLRLHKDNVNEMEIEGYNYDKSTLKYNNIIYDKVSKKKCNTYNGTPKIKRRIYKDKNLSKKQIKGRKLFFLMTKEFEAIFTVVIKNHYHLYSNDYVINNNKLVINKKHLEGLLSLTYNVFFSGKDILGKQLKNQELNCIIDGNLNNIFHQDIIIDLEILRTCHKKGVRYLRNYFSVNKTNLHLSLDFSYLPFGGHQIRLGHYYRHMFALVKHVVNQPNNLIPYEEKRKYLKIFRAQLSNHEVVMLYYNWLGGYGSDWENRRHLDNNNVENINFFTDYRIIHNLNKHLVLDVFNPEFLFSNYGYDKFLFKKGERKTDLLFEVYGIESSLSEQENKNLQEL